MNWLFLVTGLVIGWFLAVFAMASRIWGTFIRDRRNPEKFIFRFEWDKDPVKIGDRKYIIFKVVEGQLKSLKDPD